MFCATGCEPSVVPNTVPRPLPPIENNITLTDTSIVDTINTVDINPQEVIQLGEAKFFTDSFTVNGEGYTLNKHTDYAVIRILFDDDGKIMKVETLSDLPWKVIDKNTIYLKRGANLTRVSRHFKIPIDDLLNANPTIKNPNHLPALTRLKLR